MPKLLALTSRLPYPPREGHQLRSWHLLRALARVYDITLLSFARKDDPIAECNPLREIVSRLETFPIPSENSRGAAAVTLTNSLFSKQPYVALKYVSSILASRIAELKRGADLIHVDMLPLMACISADVTHPCIVLNEHNVEHLLLAQRAKMEKSWPRRMFLRNQTARLETFERAACSRAARILACSSVDAGHLRALAPATPVSIVPNGVDLEFNQPAPTVPRNSAQLVFVGQMGWFPNRDAMQWFLAEIFPRVLAVRPDVELLIVGKPAGLHVPQSLSSNVCVAGFVPDVRDAIRDASVYIVPLRAGSGTRLKVLEAMALGKAIVTTRIGAEGIALRDGADVIFADSAADFASATLRLLSEPNICSRMGMTARRTAEAHYGWGAIGDALLPVYAELLEDKRLRIRHVTAGHA